MNITELLLDLDHAGLAFTLHWTDGYWVFIWSQGGTVIKVESASLEEVAEHILNVAAHTIRPENHLR